MRAALEDGANPEAAGQALVKAGLLHRLDSDRFLVRHELVRAAVCAQAPEPLIAETHSRAAQYLHARVQAGDATAIGQRAHHAMLARDRVDSATTLSWVLEASRSARGQCAYDEAVVILELARRRLKPTGAQEVRLLLALARSLPLAGRTDEAKTQLVAALRRAQALADPVLYAQVVLTAGERYVLGDVMEDLVARIDDALEGLGTGERTLRARLLARKAAALTPARDVAGTLRIADEANRLIHADDPILARIQVALGVGAAMADFAPAAERAVVSEELRTLAQRAGDRALELRGLARLFTDALECGQVTRADTLLEEHAELSASMGQPRFQWRHPLLLSMRAMGEGRFDDCHAAVEEVQARAAEIDDPNVLRCLDVHRTHLYLVMNDVDALDGLSQQVSEALRTMPSELSIVVGALIALRRGDGDRAREAIAVITPDLPHCATTTLCMLIEVAAEVGDEALQRAIRRRLAPLAGSHANWGLFALTSGPPVSACLGLLDWALGDLQRAERHFSEALKQTTEAGLCAQRVWVKHWWSQRARDADTAALLRSQGRDEAQRLGIQGLFRSGHGTTPSQAGGEAQVVMEQREGGWCVKHNGRELMLPDLRGMKMLAQLVDAPGQEIHALDLVAEVDGMADAGDAGEQLDTQAVAAYRTRVERLRAEVAEAESAGNENRALAAQEELEALLSELKRGVGLRGQPRRAASASERARVSAQRRIRAALRKISEQDQALGEKLNAAVRTGMRCVYRP